MSQPELVEQFAATLLEKELDASQPGRTQNTVSPSARDAIPCLPTMDELDADPALDELDADPALDELSKATDSLAAGKAPGSDGIPPDLLKHCKSAVFFHCSKSSVNVGRKARHCCIAMSYYYIDGRDGQSG
ncbi:hypothetical protein ACOMHN_015941 [Nucella lapillus]